MSSETAAQDFFASQLKYPRVQVSWKEKKTMLTALLTNAGLSTTDLRIFIRAFKEQDKLEVWAKKGADVQWKLLKDYPVCSKSGQPGPKVMQGDGQVPEGVYSIDRFNPASSYYLSLGVSYPNTIDKIRSRGVAPGGDIFIHGNCVTIGCLPLTDDLIKEVYLLAVLAKSSGQTSIPVHIFPFRMEEAITRIALKTEQGEKWDVFWKNLQVIYADFESTKQLKTWQVSKTGGYE